MNPGTSDLARLLPHAGTARMIERVVRWDDQQILAATSLHRSAANPLRLHGRLAAVHLAEFAAQVMAIHGGLRNEAAGLPPQPGLLVSVRDLTMRRDYVDDLPGELEIEARALLLNRDSWQYSFEVRHQEMPIASGRAAAVAQATPP